MSAETLAPCPFCGDPEPYVDSEHPGNEVPLLWVSCIRCLAEGPTTFDGPEEAVRMWNTRATSPHPTAGTPLVPTSEV